MRRKRKRESEEKLEEGIENRLELKKKRKNLTDFSKGYYRL